MNNKNIVALMMVMIFSLVACGGPKKTDLAAQAMERARAAEASTYAPAEWAKAEQYFNNMNEAVAAKKNKEAAMYADQTVTAANEAAARARENKATIRIGELTKLLELAQKLGIPDNNGQAYNQAAQAHIDAGAFRDAKDFEKAITSAEQGIDILNGLISDKANLARDLIEQARNMYKNASNNTDTAKSRDLLENARSEINKATEAYSQKDFDNAITYAQSAVDMLQEAMDLYGIGSPDGKSAVGKDNLQLQAYQLMRQLEQTIAYIKKNGYTNNTPVPAAQNTNISETFMPAATPEATPADEEIFIIMEEEMPQNDEAMDEDAVSYMPLLFRAQTAEVVTFAMIEEKYADAQSSYGEANYINAIDNAREGLRLADLYLSTQVLATHKVIRGDTLWGISGRYYNKRFLLWPNIWRANKLDIKDPDLIYPGQMFRVPPVPAGTK